jgi:hypothetical protein
VKFQVLFSVDLLTRLGNFKNLFKSNQTLLPKVNLFLMTCSTSVQIYQKIIEVRKYLFQGSEPS